MAAIDKIYTDSYKEYTEFIKWVSDLAVIPNTINNAVSNNIYNMLYNRIYKWEKKDFNNNVELPIINTSRNMDYYLIKFCPLKIVQDKMNEVYNKKFIDAVKNNKINALEFYYEATY